MMSLEAGALKVSGGPNAINIEVFMATLEAEPPKETRLQVLGERRDPSVG